MDTKHLMSIVVISKHWYYQV